MSRGNYLASYAILLRMTCWIYDLDGVVTHLTEKKITNPELLAVFTKQLQNNEPITLNTGRSLPFIREKVLTPLVEYMHEQNLPESLLHNFFAVGEKGNAWIEDEKNYFDLSTAMPEEFAQKVQQLIEKDFADTMFFDTTKKTMISTEMHTGLSIDTYLAAQKKLIPKLEDMLKEANLADQYHIDPTVTATDIQHNTAGKAKGTKRILEWLEKRQLHPEKFAAFGDSKGDLGTGEELQRQNKQFDFVFVGEKDIIQDMPSFPVTFTNEKYDKGVVEYIESIEASLSQ